MAIFFTDTVGFFAVVVPFSAVFEAFFLVLVSFSAVLLPFYGASIPLALVPKVGLWERTLPGKLCFAVEAGDETVWAGDAPVEAGVAVVGARNAPACSLRLPRNGIAPEAGVPKAPLWERGEFVGALAGWMGALAGWMGAFAGWMGALAGWMGALAGWVGALAGWVGALAGWMRAVRGARGRCGVRASIPGGGAKGVGFLFFGLTMVNYLSSSRAEAGCWWLSALGLGLAALPVGLVLLRIRFVTFPSLPPRVSSRCLSPLMAITGNASYIPTMNEFLAHWDAVEVALGSAFEVNVNGVAVARDDFSDQRRALETAQDEVQDKLNDVEIARGQINLDKARLFAWLTEFNGLIDAYYQGTKFANARPLAPGLGDGQEVFLRPMKDIKSLWLKVNAAPARPGLVVPIVLSDDTTQAQFATALGETQDNYDAIAVAEQALGMERVERNLIQDQAYETMKLYRLAVPPRCRQHPAVVATLPRLTPEKGSTPDALTATAVVQEDGQIKVTHAVVTQAGIKRVALRGNPGDHYAEDDAVTFADHLPTAPPEFIIGWGSVTPGGSLALKVYVINETDNEAGSETLVVTRPAA